MTALYVLIPVAIGIVAVCIWIFFWAVDSGQYDDLDSPAHSILFDDDEKKLTPTQAQNAEPASEKSDDTEPPARG